MRSIKLTHVGFRAHVNIASSVVSYRIVTSFSVQFLVAMFFQTTSEKKRLVCLAEVAQLPLGSSSDRVFSWRRNQETVVHRHLGESDNDKNPVVVKKYVGRLTPDNIFGGLQLSRKDAAALRLDSKRTRLVGL